MDGSNGTIRVEFCELTAEPTVEMLDRINDAAQGGPKLRTDDVHVRAMFITSDEVNSQGGRFRDEDLDLLSGLIPGSPVMIGHDRSKLPIGRCFASDVVDRLGARWVKAWFYWLRDCSDADDLRLKIDGGVCTECSLSFSFALPECSVCGGDIRRCSHVVGKVYQDAFDSAQTCHYIYTDIKAVNEVSLVYKGAVPGAAISKLANPQSRLTVGSEPDPHGREVAAEAILDLAAASPVESDATASPVYHGLPISISPAADAHVFADLPEDWKDMESVRQIVSQCSEDLAPLGESNGVVVFMRGKSRLPLFVAESERDSVVSTCRCRVKLYIDSGRKSDLPKSSMHRLRDHGIDLITRIPVNDSTWLTLAASKAPHEGLLIQSHNNRFVYRSQPRFLLAVRDIARHSASRYSYDLAFGSEPERIFRSYDTRIAAEVGDTLYVDATVDTAGETPMLRKLTVLDNIKSYFRPDSILKLASEGASERCDLYALAPDKAALRLSGNSHSLYILFPSFSVKQLMSGKTLVGYGLPDGGAIPLKHRIERGSVAKSSNAESGRSLSFRGVSINGDFVIRPATLLKERVWLLHRAS